MTSLATQNRPESEKVDEWPPIELCAPKLGILSQFSSISADSVAHVLVRELAERVDRPSAAEVNSFKNDTEVEWVMQVNMDNNFSTPDPNLNKSREFKILLLSSNLALTASPHDCCPKQLLTHPDRYFRKILEALRHVFLDRPSAAHPSEFALCLSRQGAQIRIILNTVQHINATVVDEFRDECWSRSLLFLINTTDQLLSIGGNGTAKGVRGGQESVGCLMAGDLCHALFDCWLQAALNELVPSPSYWRTLSALCWRCLHHVPLVECWARGLLQLSVLLLRNLYGHELANAHIDETRIFGTSVDDSANIFQGHLSIAKNVWLNMFNLLGTPANFTREMYAQIGAHLVPNSADFVHSIEQTSLAFFLAVLAYKKLVDMFFDDPSVYIDFNESEDLHCQWLDALMNAGGGNGEQRHNEWDQQQHHQQQHRLSNMSSLSVSHLSVPNTPAPSVAAAASSVGMARKSVAVDFPPYSSCSAAAPELVATALQLQLNSASSGNKVRAEQHVWYTLRNNEFKQYNNNFNSVGCSVGASSSFPVNRQHHPLSGPLLAVFLQCLGEPALFQLHQSAVTSNATATEQPQKQQHQQRLSVFAPPLSSSTTSTNSTASSTTTIPNTTTGSSSNCGNYCSDPAMLGAVPHQFRSPADFPAVEGVAAGRSTALAALCRIVCAKRSRERLDDEQLAQFFTILHEALISRDRLMLCALLYHTSDELFKLALNGVQILLPNYVMAIDIVHTESMKLRLHPSVSQAEMRAACLRALASVLAWPSVFGSNLILSRSLSPSRNRISRQGSSANLLETEQRYTDLRVRMQRVLVHSLRNETVPANVQLALALCTLFACESARYDLAVTFGTTAGDDTAHSQTATTTTSAEQRDCGDTGVTDEQSAREEVAPPFSISLVRAIVSALCDNLCKPGWASDTLCCLAAFDCLNCLSSLSHQILFHQGELSIGSLIITSLCRFIDQQLQKSPPHHSRDMHSTVVAAYSCMNVWLNAAPALAEIESCLSTVAQSIELGVTGGKEMAPDQYKPASQRVRDAAEMLLHSLFTETHKKETAVDEFALVQKFGMDLAQFRHFYIGESTILSLYEAQPIVHLSDGLPAVVAIFRTPFYEPWATLLQLLPRAMCRPKKCGDKSDGTVTTDQQRQQHNGGFCSPSSSELSAAAASVPSPGTASLSAQTPAATEQNGANGTRTAPVKQFEIPREVLQPQCKLDAQFPRLEPVPGPVAEVQSQLAQIRARLAQGNAPIGDRDTRNVWLNASLGAILTKVPTPESPVAICNSLRVFLYDMGLLNRRAFGREFTPLDNSSFEIFYDSLSVTVDQLPVRLTETVSLFYVREGQRNAEEILQNNIDLRQTNALFCRLMCQLGRPTARKAPPQLNRMKIPPSPKMAKRGASVPSLPPPPLGHSMPPPQPHPQGYVLDGLEHYIRWRDAQVEIAFVMPTGRMLPQNVSPSAPFGNATGTTAAAVPLAEALDRNNNSSSTNINNNGTKISAMSQQQQKQQQAPAVGTVPTSARRTTIAATTSTTIDHQQHRQKSTHNKDFADHSTEFAHRTLQANIVLRELDYGRSQLLWKCSIDEIQGMETEIGQKRHQQLQRRQAEDKQKQQQLVMNNSCATEHDDDEHGDDRGKQQHQQQQRLGHGVMDEQQQLYLHHKLEQLEHDVPTCRATILTVPPSTMAAAAAEAVPQAMTLMTATHVIVRSARFTTKWRRNTLLARERMARETSSSSLMSSIDGRQLMQEEENSTDDTPKGKAAKDEADAAAQVKDALHRMKEGSTESRTASRESDHCDNANGRCSRKCSSVLGSARAVPRRRRPSSLDASIDSSTTCGAASETTHNSEAVPLFGGTAAPFSERPSASSAAGADLAELVCSTECGGASAVNRHDSIIRFIDAHSPPISPLSPTAVAGGDERIARRRSSIFRDMIMLGTGGGSDRRKSVAKCEQQQQQGPLAAQPLETVPKKTTPPLSDQPTTSASSSVTSMSSYFKSFFRRTSKTPLQEQTQAQNAAQENNAETNNNGTTTERQPSSSCRLSIVPSNIEQLNVAQLEQCDQDKLEQFSTNTSSKASALIGRRESAMTRNNDHQQEERRNGSLIFPSDECHANGQPSVDRARTKSCVSADETASTTSKSEAATVTTTTAATAKTFAKRSADQRILVVWLERTEDMDTFPLDELLQFTPLGTVPFTAMAATAEPSATRCAPASLASAQLHSANAAQHSADHLCFFLCPIEQGLCRVQVAGVWTKYGQPGPLLNGTVVSMTALPSLLRQTICNVARRKAAELENYQMTHVRRRHAIAEFGRRFPSRLNYTDFVEQLISEN
ncbi:hypothetical protein niasHT_001272 [Heterodera trifolii]|uniref:Ral GTPase-activating protein subunit alpha/beta N-terminal domain-containing protein n=1 Tax=Heterodera trifolii TaxID=157864 RepID=A0ABD2M7P6_9BILA